MIASPSCTFLGIDTFSVNSGVTRSRKRPGNMGSRNNRFIGGSGSLGRWRWPMSESYATPAGECSAQEGLGRTGSGSGSHEGITGKKVVRPQSRRAMALLAIQRGVSQRRAAWLCTTARSGLHYCSKLEQRDRHLSSALRIVARAGPGWGYRLAGGYLRLRGWKANDKRIYRLWRLNGLCLPPYWPSRKIRTGAKLEGLALRRNASR